MAEHPVCRWCEEPILPGDWPPDVPAVEMDAPMIREMHQECALRSVIGSVGHLIRRCTCYGGTEEDPPGMTRRQAARAAAELYEAQAVTRAGLTIVFPRGPRVPS